jgi:hypothetical protein
MHAQEMISTHPDVHGNVDPSLIRCIEACFDCAQACIACADACLGEAMVADLRQCIRLNQDCADICQATGRLATRRTGSDEGILKRAIQLCAEVCRECAEECGRHARQHAHCRICADACRACHGACQDAAGTITPGVH